MKKMIRLFITLIILFGLLFRLGISISIGIKEHHILYAILDYFSYFTIQTNILLLIYYILLTKKTFNNERFPYPVISGGIVLYISITGLVYATLLAPINPAKGIHLVYIYTLHYITPPLALLDWIIWEERRIYKWKYALIWLTYPLFYFIFIIVRGLFAHNYPYPFISVNVLGYNHALQNAFWMSCFFMIIGTVTIYLNKILK